MPQFFKAVIVDDEDLARVTLKEVLKSFPEITVAGEADSVKSAVEVIVKTKPDILFLDVQMPGESGFDLLDKLDSRILTVFVTAYDAYAIRAFEVNALDYLLKPVNVERLRQTLDRIEEIVPKPENAMRQLNYDDLIYLQVNNKCRFVKINTITAITSNADYTTIYFTDKSKMLLKKTMKEWELRLPDNNFVRIHRETIINTNYITRTEEWFNYSFKIFIDGIEKPFVMSKRYAQKIKNILG